MLASSTATSGGRRDSHGAMVLAACQGQHRALNDYPQTGATAVCTPFQTAARWPARPHRGYPEAVKPKPPVLSGARPKASLSASNNWGSLLSRSTSIFTEGIAVTSGVMRMHIEPWEGALLPRRTARLLEGAGGPPGRWNPGRPFWSLF